MKYGFQLHAEHMFRFGASSHIGHCYSQAHQVQSVLIYSKKKSQQILTQTIFPVFQKYPLDLFFRLPIQLLSESLQKAAV